MRGIAFVWQFGEVILAVALAPLFSGWIAQCRAWMQNRTAPPLTQPYRMLHKLFYKDAALATNASRLFRTAPYVLFGTMVLAAAIIPSVVTDLPFARAADAIALIGLFATARVFQALAAMDIGTAFGTLGARREMMIGFLAEPAMLMVFFNAFLLFGSTALTTLVDNRATHPSVIDPSVIFAAIAFIMVLLAENARIPIDNPATHLELTMIHEAMVLEYSARHLALIELASSMKLFNYACIGLSLFLPWGIAIHGAHVGSVLIALAALLVKLAFCGAGIALIESVSAKLRIFRAPEFMAMAFLIAVLGLLVHLLLGANTIA
ncbi:respiratory chain complex I subunit 1 family protein [Occallatibacter riparius]|uniref:NADH-quinone oxidoreductase subunit H n=1 Tax=Occallatibacter riparius TaxID=1002689 RepID=A0A9J7BP77_9BACT|nr:NADH-quinone oxidoreductase subunit H [Occallatibacter riparius]UWZ84423.1 NADH-quinone oxidoreductase subunit H [Occallatibacter riparius]